MNDPSFRASLEARAADAGVLVSISALAQFERYRDLLRKWNSKINLTALPLEAPSAAALDRLFVEPLLAVELMDPAHQVWFDLGSGNGSPAIPIKLIRQSLALTMVEAVAKKAAFLREAVHVLGLRETKVLTCRIEELPSGHPETVDLITLRGVRLDTQIALACRSLLNSAGHLITFGPTPDLPREDFQLVDRRDFQAGQSSVGTLGESLSYHRAWKLVFHVEQPYPLVARSSPEVFQKLGYLPEHHGSGYRRRQPKRRRRQDHHDH